MVSKWLRRTVLRRTLFAAVVIVLTSTVGWLGWRVLLQDEQLASQRLVDDREAAADLVVAAFDQRLSAIERDLDAALARGQLPRPTEGMEGALVMSASDASIHIWPEDRLRYYPQLPVRKPVHEADLLVRRAQASLKAGRFDEAFALYEQLEHFGPAPIGDDFGGIPAALAADVGRMAAYRKQGSDSGLSAAAHHLSESLRAARWPVSSATYEFLDSQVRESLSAEPELDPVLVLSEAVSWLWEQRTAEPGLPPSGRVSRVFPSGPVLIVWRSSSHGLAAWVAGRDALDAVWLPAVNPLTGPRRAHVAMTTADGQPIVGAVSPPDRPAVRLASTTLPWTIQITNTADDSALTVRRRFLLGAMSVLALLIVAGAWLVERTVSRELAVADLKSDFVSAVSHEFRTPLTSLCQLSELLMRGRVASEDDRRQYYELLHEESQRLRRLVEGLLNFGRLEAGRMEFRFEDVDAGALARRTIDEFAASPQARGHRVELTPADATLLVRADADVLKTALWNLLENAAKYSPDCDTIWVMARRHGDEIALSVRDRGVGVPRGEQRQVFEKFVRGTGARASDVGGTGVGLAMARRIVEAHGGGIMLESVPGEGSTFTVTLPLVNSQVPTPKTARAVTAG